VEANGNGGAWLDYDGDGDLDILLVSGGTLAEPAPPGRLVALYANDGSGRFTDVTERTGLAASGWGMGVCTGDVDRDGAVDFYVTAWGPNRLFRNRGDGTFEEIAAAAGVDDPCGATAVPSLISTATARPISTSPTMLTSIRRRPPAGARHALRLPGKPRVLRAPGAGGAA
jgi:hypothetical protein